MEELKCDADFHVPELSADGSPLDVVASVINDKWVGLDVTISQQVTRGAKLKGEPPPKAGEVQRLGAYGLGVSGSLH
jgi:hypothetical protein